MTPSPIPLTAGRTDVLGYINKNSYPVQITSDHLGLNIQVPGKVRGAPPAYVLDRAGRKINDPRLDFYCASGLLAKEYSPEPGGVPIIALSTSPVVGAGPSTSVTASMTPAAPVAPVAKTPVRASLTPFGALRPPGALTPPTVALPAPTLANRLPAAAPQVQPAQPGVGAPGIQAMSVAQAAKLGIIPRPDRRDHFSNLPDEDKTGEAARSAPSIDKATPPMTKPIIPQGLELRSAEVDAAALGASDVVRALPTPVSAVVPAPAAPAAPAPSTVVAAPEAPKAPRPTVEFGGKMFSTAGTLKRALLKQFNGDKAMADEAFEPYRGRFAPQGPTKSAP